MMPLLYSPRVALPQRASLAPLGLALVVAMVAVVGYWGVHDVPLLVDEIRHYDRIQSIRDGIELQFEHSPCIHTYHAILAALSRVTGVADAEGTRLLSLVVSLICVVLAFNIARRTAPNAPCLSAAQLLFLPTILPFFFLLYTDVLGLLFVLLAVLLTWDDRMFAAALAAIAAVLVRQTHIVWMLFTFALPYVRAHGWKLQKEEVLDHLRRGWLFLVGFAGFALFVLINRGVALGDSKAHPAFQFRTGNVAYALFVVFVVFLPLHLANLRRIVRLVRARPWSLLVVAGVFLLLWFVTRFDHPYNDWRYFLRNKLFHRVEESVLWRGLFFSAIAFTILSLAVTRLRESGCLLLYPIAILSLAPSWLVDPRYAMPALALFVLFRARRSEKLEWAVLAWCALLSAIIAVGTFRQAFFL